jgi:short-subunit dehydrogenase
MKHSFYNNKVVWITGASSGIGFALAKELSQLGAKLILSSRTPNSLEEVQAKLGLDDQNALIIPLDLSIKEDFTEEVSIARNHFGQIDLLINNAGISQRSGIKESDFGVYKKLMQTNYFGTIGLSLAVLKVFEQQQFGHFAVVSSISGKLGSPKRAGYCASKHALHGFFDALRSEYHNENITVTMLCPGYIQTNISINALDSKGEKYNRADTNQKNGLSAEACAKKMIQAIAKKKNEVYIGKKEVIGVYLKRFFPDILNRIVRNHAPR